MAKSKKYVAVSPESETCWGIADNIPKLIKDLNVIGDRLYELDIAVPSFSRPDEVFVAEILHPLNVRPRGVEFYVPKARTTSKPKPKTRKPHNGTGHRATCDNPECHKGPKNSRKSFIAHGKQRYCCRQCQNHINSLVQTCVKYVVLNDRKLAPFLTLHPFLLQEPYKSRITKLSDKIDGKYAGTANHDSRGITIFKNTPSKG